ncbi:hypothetical protein IGI04_029235 [Brassica rapa subsp. trilocularis]|uniref:Zinc knuckle CX2CX4HX4C domain-containing protein n=1 Tax=Brassica rapa subsp. trilocularis TaxID=1813537 RepID=A0ABQ7LM98_BRACM|nr:hypothetical protein IGI04_029235 [Brassica rapa subsp. trilocularis]
MARRYNRDEKEKWAAPPTPPPKRPPVRIPANNTEDLVAANRLTIIGRVTNTTLQKPRAIEKHCFTCFSLFHEECDCPHRDPRTPAPKGRTLGITQAIALQRIEAEKRRHDERRGFRRSDDSRPPINSHDNRYSQLRRDQPSDNYYYERREDRRQPSIFSRTARPNTSYRRNNGSTMQYRVVDRTRNDAVSHSNQSPLQRSDKRDGEAMNLRRTSTEHAPQNSINTPPPRSVKERLGAPQGTTEDANSGSRDRRSALELQEAVLTTEEEGTEHREQELHIEEASQNRVPANLRLGVSKAGPSNKKRGTIPVSTQSKTAGKRKVLRTPRKRVACSPLSGLNIRKSTVINTVSTTRRKLLADRPVLGHQGKRSMVEKEATTKSAPLAGLLAHSAEAAGSQLISARRTVRVLGRWSGSGSVAGCEVRP